MMDYIKKIKFPLIDLSIKDWNNEDINEIVIYNEFFYSSDEKFIKYCLGHIVIDLEGNIYEIVEKKDMGAWRKYIPFIKKSKLIFKECHDKKSLEELKKYLVNQIKTINVLSNRNDKKPYK